jgi:uncharacterized alpha-E superfamily protein
MTYRARYFTLLEPAAVLDLVIADETNPRALAFQLAALDEHVRHLPRERPGAIPSAEGRQAAQVLAVIRRADMGRLAWTAEAGTLPSAGPGAPGSDAGRGRPHLERLLAALIGDLFTLSDAVSDSYFKHAAAAVPGHGLAASQNAATA